MMNSNFLPKISLTLLKQKYATNDIQGFFDIICQPLHEELYRRKTFDFLDDISTGQQLILCYDYAQAQILQGGFIQLFQNGYIGLLPEMPERLAAIGAVKMAMLIYEVMEVYVQHKEKLDKETNLQEFAKLYIELGEFEKLDKMFADYHYDTLTHMVKYASEHMEEFIDPEEQGRITQPS